MAVPFFLVTNINTKISGDKLSDEQIIAQSLQDDQKTAAALQSTSTDKTPQVAGSGFMDLSLIFSGAMSYFSAEEPLALGGHDPPKTGFTFQQLELHMAANADPFFHFQTNVVFNPSEVEVEEAYATTLAMPGNFQMRAGQFLTRFGRANATHLHAWHFVDQPLIFGKMFGSEGSRGLGVETSWLSVLPWYAEVVVSLTNADGDCCARSFVGDEDVPIKTPKDLLLTLAFKQFFPLDLDWSLMVGISSQVGPHSSGKDHRAEIYGADLYVRYKPTEQTERTSLSLQTEVLWRRRQILDDVLVDYGGYTQVVYDLNQCWGTGIRYEYVTGVQDDPLDPEWFGNRNRWAFEVTYRPSHFSQLRLQTGYSSHAQQIAEDVWSVVVALEVMTGAHGAHTY